MKCLITSNSDLLPLNCNYAAHAVISYFCLGQIIISIPVADLIYAPVPFAQIIILFRFLVNCGGLMCPLHFT